MKYTSLGLHSVEIKVKYYSVIFMCMNVFFYLLQSVPQYAFFFKNQVPYKIDYIGLNFHQIVF